MYIFSHRNSLLYIGLCKQAYNNKGNTHKDIDSLLQYAYANLYVKNGCLLIMIMYTSWAIDDLEGY